MYSYEFNTSQFQFNGDLATSTNVDGESETESKECPESTEECEDYPSYNKFTDDDNSMEEHHAEGWVTRMMRVRGANFRKNGASGLRWTILPPEFRDILIFKEIKFAAMYANGTHELYPLFWEVDYVYIPLCTRVVEDWYLVRINL
ncbi:hypothetical protein R6Q57_015913 [Mikania cordata]